MKVFVTGGTGFIGSSVVSRLVNAGHEVVALNRSSEKDELLTGLGATPHAGDLLEPESYREAAGGADAIVHAAFDYDQTQEGDRAALDTFLQATAGRESRLLYTSGCWVVGDTGGELVGDDASTDDPAPLVRWRVPQERRVVDANEGGRTATVVRPGMVYGGEGALTARMFRTASENGAAEYIGDGMNHWSMIHVEDLAALYAVLLERSEGGIVQAVDGVPVRVGQAAVAASHACGGGGATVSVPVEKAREKLGPVADALLLDQRLAAPTALALGWAPERTSFMEAAESACAEWRASRDG